jgi:hypothetical protein
MNEDELKGLIGDKAFEAMSAEQRTATLGKFAKPDPKPDPKTDPKLDDPSLSDKVKKEKEERDRKNSDSKSLEGALMFNMGSAEFLKTNEAILPKEVVDIFKIAERETYGSALEKANATKAAIIQSYFSQQANLEILTPSQQSVLADYLKLTKNGKEDKASEMYDNLFEPALNAMKRIKKAEEILKSKSGMGGTTDSEQAYKDKLMTMADKKFSRGKK